MATEAMRMAAAIVLVIFALWFAIRGYRDGRRLRKHLERLRQRPRVVDPRDISAATHEYAAGRFGHHFAKLRAIVNDPSLWPDGADRPSEDTIAWTSGMLDQLIADKLPPTRVVASAEGGVAICFVSGDKYADIEFLNSGEILGVASNRRDRPTVWEISPNSAGMSGACAKIRDFIR